MRHPLAIASILSLFICSIAASATITVPAGGGLQAAYNSANSGDTIELGDGTFTGGLNFSGKTDITVRARNSLKATLWGGQVVMSGRNCQLVGVKVSGVRTSWYTGAVLVTGAGNKIIGCDVVDNESLGIDISGGDATLIENTRMNRNGNLGLNTGSPTSGNNVEGLTIRNCEAIGNNYGMADPIWKAIAGKTVFGTNGLWYRGAGDAAGGMKICNAFDVLVEDCVVKDNTGAGLWFDVFCGKKVVRRVRSHGQKSIPGDPAYFAVGIEVELENFDPAKPVNTLIENCYSYDNAGSEYAVFESSNVVIKDCLAGGDVEFRDLGRASATDLGRENQRPRNIRLENVKMTGQVRFPNARTQAEVTLVNVAQKLTSLPAWSGAPSLPTTNPTPTPTQPASESASGTIVTEAGKPIVDAAGNVWMITTGRKITRNGVEQGETNGVEKLQYADKIVYQTAHNLWWKWSGTWLLTTAPSAPATQPTTQPADDLAARVAKLEQQLAAEKVARVADAATIAGLQAELAAARAKLSEIHQLSQ